MAHPWLTVISLCLLMEVQASGPSARALDWMSDEINRRTSDAFNRRTSNEISKRTSSAMDDLTERSTPDNQTEHSADARSDDWLDHRAVLRTDEMNAKVTFNFRPTSDSMTTKREPYYGASFGRFNSRRLRTGTSASGNRVMVPRFDNKLRSRILSEMRKFKEGKSVLGSDSRQLQRLHSNRPNPLAAMKAASKSLDSQEEEEKGTSLSIGLDLRTLTEMLELQKQNISKVMGLHQKLINIG